ncbi:sigma factor-like helix-turn-helix DNA-binding protein, partial [Kitasatospora sp. NPDC058965]|uniref:sigma factor-like helix-turn-helix DNA-binding protein n=1 Tax=Kitasatospora sp. NPDC058965 TaxID=3346682 RepID=UPI00367F9482
MCQDGPEDQAVEPTPAGFEAVYARCGTHLLQQAYLLTGRRRTARAAVHRAFAAAWPHWARTAAGPDPVGRLRRRTCEAALAPWRPVGPRRTHRLTPPRRRIAVPPLPDAAGRDRALLTALRRLSRPRRRVVLLHDALGLTPGEVAAEVEASTTAVAARLAAAHRELARTVPALVGADPDAPEFGARLGGLLYRAAERGCPGPPGRGTAALRARGRLRAVAPPLAAAALVL